MISEERIIVLGEMCLRRYSTSQETLQLRLVVLVKQAQQAVHSQHHQHILNY